MRIPIPYLADFMFDVTGLYKVLRKSYTEVQGKSLFHFRFFYLYVCMHMHRPICLSLRVRVQVDGLSSLYGGGPEVSDSPAS